MIGLVTDSASQMPPDLASRLGVEVVPVIVTLDGKRFLEGVDLTPSDFWSRFAAYGTADGAATEIVSIHVGADHSGTLNASRLAAELVDLPVHLVDSGTASFGVSCCVWEAAEVLARDGSAAEAATRAKEAAASVGTTFIMQALEFARAGGRWDDRLPDDHDGVMVLGGLGGAADLLATGHTVDELCDRMVEPMLRDGVPIRAGVSLADPATIVFTEGIESRLRESAVDVDLVRYEVGASIGAHTGPGTAGGFWYPVG